MRAVRGFGLALLLTAAACQSRSPVAEGASALDRDVFVEQLRPGVWRHVSNGQGETFDRIFRSDTELPRKNESLAVERTYRPIHNIGHFRFVDIDGVGARRAAW